MKFGLFYEWPNPATGSWKRLFEEGLEQIQYAEEVGFDFVLVAEHHFSNYGMSPAPLLQALAIAQRTRRIRVGTAVIVLPIWQPLRLAEEVAVLDNLSDGRFIVGIGRGYQPHEFARFGVTPQDSRQRFNECLEVLVKAWTHDTSFTYHGEHYQLPHDTVVWPKPLQKPYPPIWVAGTSPDTLKLAAERDFAPIVSGFNGVDAVRDAVAGLLRFKQSAGKPTEAWEMGVQTFCCVCDTNEEARANMRYPRWQNRAGRALNSLAVVDGRVQVKPYEGEPPDDVLWERLFFGDPDRVAAKYRQLAQAGATFASCWMMAGGIEHEKVMRTIRLMGEHVLPAVRDVRPAAGLAAELLRANIPTDAFQARGQAPSE